MRVRVCVCVRACVRACVRVAGDIAKYRSPIFQYVKHITGNRSCSKLSSCNITCFDILIYFLTWISFGNFFVVKNNFKMRDVGGAHVIVPRALIQSRSSSHTGEILGENPWAETISVVL